MSGSVEQLNQLVKEELTQNPEVGQAIISMIHLVSKIAQEQHTLGVKPNETTVFTQLTNSESSANTAALFYSLVMDNAPDAKVFSLNDLLQSQADLKALGESNQR